MKHICVAIALFAAGMARAGAQVPQTHIGVLTCTTGDSQSAGPDGNSSVKVLCGFKVGSGGNEERHIGVIGRKKGAEPLAGKRVLVWTVLGPAKIPPGALAQRFALSATPQSPQGPALTGETNPKIILQSET